VANAPSNPGAHGECRFARLPATCHSRSAPQTDLLASQVPAATESTVSSLSSRDRADDCAQVCTATGNDVRCKYPVTVQVPHTKAALPPVSPPAGGGKCGPERHGLQMWRHGREELRPAPCALPRLPRLLRDVHQAPRLRILDPHYVRGQAYLLPQGQLLGYRPRHERWVRLRVRRWCVSPGWMLTCAPGGWCWRCASGEVDGGGTCSTSR